MYNNKVLNEIDSTSLAKIALATAAGIASGKYLYKKYKQDRAMKKYMPQEINKKNSTNLNDELRDDYPELLDIISMGRQEFRNSKK